MVKSRRAARPAGIRYRFTKEEWAASTEAAPAKPPTADADTASPNGPQRAPADATENEVSDDFTAQDFELLDAGTYGVQLDAISPPQMGEYGEFVKLTFGVFDPTDWSPFYDSTGQPFKLVAQASKKMTPRAKLRAWFEALIGREFGPGEGVNRGALIGKRGLAMVVQAQGAKGGTFNNIEALSPLPKKRAGGPAPAATRPNGGGATAVAEPAVAQATETDLDEVPF